MSSPRKQILETFRCPACHEPLQPLDASANGSGALKCSRCDEMFPVVNEIPRLVLRPLREALMGNAKARGNDARQVRTALSFGFEWHQFPQMYAEWEQSFLDYMQPHGPDFFSGRKVLDAGCGNGRFAFYAARYGADVWAIDLGPAIEVAHQNTADAGRVQVAQADLHDPPFAFESFDFIYSIGVLHHLPDPEPAFQNLLRFLKPGGEIQIYLYWKPEGQPLKRAMLGLVAAARQITTRLPHAAVHALAYPAGIAAYIAFVWPYQLLKRIPGLARWSEKFPMKQYANFPFRVCVNDQLDRFSAPIENRYTRQEVLGWLTRAGLDGIAVNAAYGWVATGRKAISPGTARADAV